MKWLDNNGVMMVSTLQTVDEDDQKLRKKLRVIRTNKKNVKEVLGKDYEANVMIPKDIDNYNHWMFDATNRCDQLIAYYRPELNCRRILMHVMIDFIDMLRVNCFLLYNSSDNDNKILCQNELKC